MSLQGIKALEAYVPTEEDPLCENCGEPKHNHKADGRLAVPGDCEGFEPDEASYKARKKK